MRKLTTFLLAGLMVSLASAQDTTKVTELEAIEVSGVRATDKTPITQKTIRRGEIQGEYQGDRKSVV